MGTSIMFNGNWMPKNIGPPMIWGVKSRCNFLEGCPTAFKSGINYKYASLDLDPKNICHDDDKQMGNVSASAIMNTSAIKTFFE